MHLIYWKLCHNDTHICCTCTIVLDSQILVCFPVSNCYEVKGHFETSTPNDPKMTLDTIRSKVHHTCYLYVQSYHVFQCPNFHSASYTTTVSCFWVRGYSETMAPNDPKMTLNSTRSQVPQISVSSVLESQISLHFTLQKVGKSRKWWYEVAENHKCTKWPQNDIEKLAVKSTLWTRNIDPLACLGRN